MLAAHPQIMSFPETNYINVIVGNREYRTIGLRPITYRQKLWSLLVNLRIICGVANRSAVPYFLRTVENIGRPDLAELMPKHPIWIKDAVQRLFKALDRDTIDHGYESWLEKTPLHYAYLDCFENNVSSAKFIHIIRNGVDVIASLYDAALKYPGTHWERDFSVIDQVYCILEYCSPDK